MLMPIDARPPDASAERSHGTPTNQHMQHTAENRRPAQTALRPYCKLPIAPTSHLLRVRKQQTSAELTTQGADCLHFDCCLLQMHCPT